MKNDIVDRYKRAWEEHDVGVLRSLFHDEVYYQERCDSVFNGIDELVAYWVENSRKQESVLFSPIKVMEDSSDIVIWWTASFYELKKQVNTTLEGIMWLSMESGKIKRLVEYFEHK
jgi:hypothetical protein